METQSGREHNHWKAAKAGEKLPWMPNVQEGKKQAERPHLLVRQEARSKLLPCLQGLWEGIRQKGSRTDTFLALQSPKPKIPESMFNTRRVVVRTSYVTMGNRLDFLLAFSIQMAYNTSEFGWCSLLKNAQRGRWRCVFLNTARFYGRIQGFAQFKVPPIFSGYRNKPCA